jgi:predicted MFS family arabinose efflux permease
LRATSFGAFYFASGVATLIANLAAGLLWDRSGAEATFIAGAGAAAVAMTMLTLLPASAEPRPAA